MMTHRFGDHGDDVGLLQRRLIRAGYPLDVTHLYDAATESAVIALQKKTGLVDDGVAGPKTLAALATGRRDPKHLSLVDLVAAADKLGVPLASVRAVNHADHSLSATLPAGATVNVTAPGAVNVYTKEATVTADTVTLDADVIVKRSMTVMGAFAFQAGMTGKGGAGGGAVMKIDGGAEFTKDVTAAGVSVSTHKHQAQGANAPTSEPTK
ncbi:peptidoglycan-binding domain-containing protein [Paraburkholderia sediminicola]|uniref:peptidoglycan-binding protein n=1 Tax=Paraburkholderia sediminicola TaxID=458836 RepID=UPI0038B96003